MGNVFVVRASSSLVTISELEARITRQLTNTTRQLTNTTGQLTNTTRQLANTTGQLANTTRQLTNTTRQLASFSAPTTSIPQNLCRQVLVLHFINFDRLYFSPIYRTFAIRRGLKTTGRL